MLWKNMNGEEMKMDAFWFLAFESGITLLNIGAWIPAPAHAISEVSPRDRVAGTKGNERIKGVTHWACKLFCVSA